MLLVIASAMLTTVGLYCNRR